MTSEKFFFFDESTFHALKRKKQCRIWRLEKEKLLPECMQQSNIGDSGKVGTWRGIPGFGTMSTKIYTGNMDGKLYCDGLQHQLKLFMAQMQNKNQIVFFDKV